MKQLLYLNRAVRLACPIVLMFALRNLAQAQVEPTILSTVPPNFATAVSPAAAVVFTFSEPMDPEATTADFLDSTTFSSLSTTPVWSAGNTVLSCTPTPAFPANRLIIWSVFGQNPNGDPLGGDPAGFFTTGSSGGNTGSGTNQITTFSLGKIHSYQQTSAAAPVLDPIMPYGFVANTTLSSNRSATSVTLTAPGGAPANLGQIPLRPEQFLLVASNSNLASFNAAYPDGNYLFRVQAATSNQQVTVNFPATLSQPPAPHLANFPAVQSVDAAQPYTLAWDAFQGGTASDYIHVSIGGVFQSADVGTTGALRGTATSVLIPVGPLQPNTTYDSSIGFYRAISTTNGSSYVTAVYRATLTRFQLRTTGTPGGPLILTNAAWSGIVFSFDVMSSVGQEFTVESASAVQGPWQTLVTTNSQTGRVQIIDLNSLLEPALFYRARNGR